MKTRTGLVSNSSSSSFIIVFPKKPQSAKEVHKRLYNGAEGSIQYYGDNSRTHAEISERVYNDLKGCRKATVKQIAEEFQTLVYHAAMEVDSGFRRDNDGISAMLNNLSMVTPELIGICKEKHDLDVEERKFDTALKAKHNVPLGYHKDYVPPEEYVTERDECRQERFSKQAELYEKQRVEVNKIALELANDYVKEHDGWWYTIIGYSDDCDGFMEHAGIFSHIECTQISHH